MLRWTIPLSSWCSRLALLPLAGGLPVYFPTGIHPSSFGVAEAHFQVQRTGWLPKVGPSHFFLNIETPNGSLFSHINAETPGCIHEGGELGYALSVSFGAVMDNPDLIVACVVGDGEAETGPTATYVHPFSVDYLLADIYPSQVLGMASSTSIPPSQVRSSLLFM